MGSLVGSVIFPLRFRNDPSSHSSGISFPDANKLSFSKSGRRIFCACVAPPRNLRPADGLSSSKLNVKFFLFLLLIYSSIL